MVGENSSECDVTGTWTSAVPTCCESKIIVITLALIDLLGYIRQACIFLTFIKYFNEHVCFINNAFRLQIIWHCYR